MRCFIESKSGNVFERGNFKFFSVFLQVWGRTENKFRIILNFIKKTRFMNVDLFFLSNKLLVRIKLVNLIRVVDLYVITFCIIHFVLKIQKTSVQ